MSFETGQRLMTCDEFVGIPILFFVCVYIFEILHYILKDNVYQGGLQAAFCWGCLHFQEPPK